ncbi:DinB family protein [Anaerosporobacter sp.]
MKYFGEGLSEKHKELSSIIRKRDKIEEAKKLFLEIHAKVHSTEISHDISNEVDYLLEDLEVNEYAIMPTSKDETIAWVLWHVARIEDLTMNILVDDGQQVFNDEWKERMNTPIIDTGNALSDDEIMDLSKRFNIKELLHYRNKVGARTREIVSRLSAEAMKRKVTQQGAERIFIEGGVTSDKESYWLLDFWSKKDVAGLLLMPPTRHVMLHLNDCFKWKEYIRKKSNYFWC